ncbi:unnamed protein product [Linum tenue]|uniref:Uncharacterized protein n=1 Tax=Linum tenue TaxID=586396 RepID=A0AAV0NK59_9ROSI|nr:unnamed protein product [Linum tenue]
MKMASKLKVLKLLGDPMIKSPDLPRSGSLEILHLQSFILHWSSGIAKLFNLKVLHLQFCEVRDIWGGTIGMLLGLRELTIFDPKNEMNLREAFAGIGELQFLEILRLDVTDDFLRRPLDERLLLGVKLHTTLKVLQTSSPVANLPELLGFGTLVSYNKLETLIISECFLLTSLPFHDLDDDCRLGLVVLNSLRYLHIFGNTLLLQVLCRKLQLLMFPCLTNLYLRGMDNADTELRLDGLESMEELVQLHLSSLPSIRRLPSLSRLGKLKGLTVSSVPNLREIEGLAGLKSLEVLDLSHCTSLESLPVDQLSGLWRLRSKDISDCKNLIGWSGLRELAPKVHIRR